MKTTRPPLTYLCMYWFILETLDAVATDWGFFQNRPNRRSQANADMRGDCADLHLIRLTRRGRRLEIDSD